MPLDIIYSALILGGIAWLMLGGAPWQYPEK